jgi:Arc/MetJ family transcription regulator
MGGKPVGAPAGAKANDDAPAQASGSMRSRERPQLGEQGGARPRDGLVRILMHRCYDAIVRTTIDLPDDLHRQAMSIARDTSRTLSETVADLMRRALGQVRRRQRSHEASEPAFL